MKLHNNKSLSNSIRNNNKKIKIYNINKNDNTKSNESSKNFFITKIDNFRKPLTIKNSNSTNALDNRNKLLEKYKIKEKENNKLKENFIDFITKYKTDFINVEQITTHYQNLEVKQKKIYDENLKLIQEKKKYLEELDLQLNTVILESIKINKEEIEKLYENKINMKKQEIKLKKHELEMYHQIFSQAYKVNYKLKNRLEAEYKYQSFYNQQHEKYSIIKNTTLYKLQKQEKLLNNLNQYFENFTASNEELISEKSKQLNKAEFEILLIKNDIINIEKAIQTLKDRISEIDDNLKKAEDYYDSKKLDLNTAFNNYSFRFAQMEEIFQVLDVKNVGQILNKYNLLKQDYNNKSYLIKLKSLDITNLNNQIKQKNEEIKNIYEKIAVLKKVNMSKKGNDTEERIILRISQIKLIVAQIYDVLKERINIFTKCANNALSNIAKIIHSMQNAVILLPFTYENKFSHEFNFILSDDMKSLNINLETEFDEKLMLKFVVALIKALYYFFSNINTNIAYLLYMEIIKEIKEKNFQKINEAKKSSKNILFQQKIEIEETNLIIYYLKSQYLQGIYDKKLNYSISRLNEKKKIYMRSPKEIFKQIYNEKTSKNNNNFSEFTNTSFFSPKTKGQNDSMEISSYKDSAMETVSKRSKKEQNKLINRNNSSIIPKDDFMKMYYTFYKNSLKESNYFNKSLPKLNFSSLSTHRFNFINQFINHNVSERLSNEKKKKEIEQRIKEKSKAIISKLKQKELIEFINKMNKSHLKLKNISGIETKNDAADEKEKDISMEQEKKEEQQKLYMQQLEESKKPKKFKLKSNEPEMNIISERLDDLRALELYFSKGNKKSVLDSNTFNEYYFKIKRVLSKTQNKFKESLSGSVNKISQTRHSNVISGYNTIKLRRNNSDLTDINSLKRNGFITSKINFNNNPNDKPKRGNFRLSLVDKNIKRGAGLYKLYDNIITEENKNSGK